MFKNTLTPIDEFCEKQHVPNNLRDPFQEFVIAEVKEHQHPIDQTALESMVLGLSHRRVEASWKRFVIQLAKTIQEA